MPHGEAKLKGVAGDWPDPASGYRRSMGEEQSWRTALARMSDAELEEFASELTETLPADDPMIVEVRYWLRRLRDNARGES